MSPGRFCAPALGLILLASPVLADAPGGAPRDLGNNAALKYWAASALIPDDVSDLSKFKDWQSTPLDESSAKAVQDCGYALRCLKAGAALSLCDWGLDYRDGPEMLLPHLNKMRKLTEVACLASRYETKQQHLTAAVEDLCDILVCARQTGRGTILISKLVQFSMEKMTVDALAAGLNRLDADSLKQLSTRLDQLPSDDTLTDAIGGEKTLGALWFIQHVKDAGATPDWAQTFSSFVNPDAHFTNDDIPTLVSAAGGTPDRIEQKLQDLLSFYDQIASLSAANPRIQDFNEKYAPLRSQYDSNPFAAILLPDFRKAYEASAAAQTRILLVRAAIAVVQSGPGALKVFQDPVEHQALEYEAQSHGFRLTSGVVFHGQPMSIIVGTEN
jgi:hypothetical protein